MAVIIGTTIAGEHVVRIDDREYRNVSESNWRRICRFCRGGSPRAPQARPPMVAFRTWWERPQKSSKWVMLYRATPLAAPDRVAIFGSYDEARDALPIDERYGLMSIDAWRRYTHLSDFVRFARSLRETGGIHDWLWSPGLS